MVVRLYAPDAGGIGLILFRSGNEDTPATQCDIKKKKKKERRHGSPRIVCLLVLFLAVLVFRSLLLSCGFLWLRRAGAALHCGV